MSMRAKMSARTRQTLTMVRLSANPCLQCGSVSLTKRREAHHALTFAGKRVDDPYAIIPLCTECHRGKSGTLADPEFSKRALALIAALADNIKKDSPHFNKMLEGDASELRTDQRARIVSWVGALDRAHRK